MYTSVVDIKRVKSFIMTVYKVSVIEVLMNFYVRRRKTETHNKMCVLWVTF